MGGARLSWSRLGRLLTELPLDSAWARVHCGGTQPWGATEFLLRNVLVALGGGEVASPQERTTRRVIEQKMDARLLAMAEREKRRQKEVSDA